MVDERRVRRLLQRVSEDLTYLEARADEDREAQARDPERLAALKYFFVTAIEGCVAVAHHLCASEGWCPPSSNADAVRLLGRHRVLGLDRAEAVARAVGFRNVLVHRYTDVDDRLVVAHLDRVGELAGFVAEVSAWMEDQRH